MNVYCTGCSNSFGGGARGEYLELCMVHVVSILSMGQICSGKNWLRRGVWIASNGTVMRLVDDRVALYRTVDGATYSDD